MRIELKRPWPRVRTGAELSCGGSQTWFPDANFRRCGCGVVACADTLLYLRGVEELTREEYLRRVAPLRGYFPLIPYRGIDGVRLAAGMNACLRKNDLRLRAMWCASGERFWDRLAGMLSDDLPAIVAVGPNFPRVWGAERLPLYRETADGGRARAAETKGHFLAVIGLDGEWMEASSWGRRLLIERRAYDDYRRRHGALFTNLLLLRRISA